MNAARQSRGVYPMRRSGMTRVGVGPIVAEINQAVRGWAPYFRVGNSSRKFAQDYVRERLALFLSKKAGQHGRHFERYTYAYFKRLGVYRRVGP